MVEVEIEVQVTFLVMADIIPINLVEDVMVLMVNQVVLLMALQMIHMELVQILPSPQSLKRA